MGKRRKAETLAEILMSILVFGIILGGITDFISNHITYVAKTKARDRIIAQLPRAMIYYYSKDVEYFPEPESFDGVSFESVDGAIVRATYSSISMDFALK